MVPETTYCQNFVLRCIAKIFNFTLPEDEFSFQFVTHFDYRVTKRWMEQNWTLGFYLVGIYIVFIFAIQNWMKTRSKFGLQGLLIIWNLLLAGFSVFGFFCVVPEILEFLNKPSGFHQSVCSPVADQSPMYAFWTFIFVLSKVPELGDTVFIVLRKQPLVFLHWYHHVTVLLYSWYSYKQHIAPSRWFLVMNLSVHAIMYSYYALKALKIRVPRQIAVTITSLQILQMVVGVIVNFYALRIKMAGGECDVPFDNLFWALGMYGSYFYLFVDFFRNSYMRERRPESVVQKNVKIQ